MFAKTILDIAWRIEWDMAQARKVTGNLIFRTREQQLEAKLAAARSAAQAQTLADATDKSLKPTTERWI